MNVNVGDLTSRMARSGPPMFFAEPENVTAYNFNQGLAAAETFPTDTLLRLAREVVDRDGAISLEYFDPRIGYEEMVYGFRGLRRRLGERAGALQGRPVPHEGVILTSGSVQAISLGINGYVDRGDVVAVEQVTFPYAVRYFEAAGADVRAVPIDREGLDVDRLEQLVDRLGREGKRLKMVYLGPTFHCPTGTELSLDRRRDLVRLAQKHGFLVLEDDVYSELRFAGDILPTLLSLDDSGLVMQTGTFSKMVAPGLRLGWMMGDPRTIAGVAAVRQDLGVSQLISRVMDNFLAEGRLEPHLAEANQVYHAKCDAAVEGLREVADVGLVRFDRPRGSFYLWVEIDESVDWDRVAAEASAAGIHFRPGERFLASEDPRRFFRMSYSQEPLERVREGSARLGEIIRGAARSRAKVA